MSEIFSKIFKNYPTDNITPMFGWVHFLLVFVGLCVPIVISILLRKNSEEAKAKIKKIIAYLLIGIYIFDFFVQPFWNGSMTYGKLPFHICTLTGVLIAFVSFSKSWKKLETIVVVWATLAPVFWMLFPFNLIDAPVALYSYTRIQSYLYHVLEFCWGAFMLISGCCKLNWRSLWQPIVGLFPMAIWATIGQELFYPNELGENFLMLRTDVSGICPHWVYIVALFVAASIAISLLYAICNISYYVKTKKNKKNL